LHCHADGSTPRRGNDQSTALRGQGRSHGAVVFLWEGTCPRTPQAHGQVDGSHALRGNPAQDALRPLCRDAERLGLHARAAGSTPRRRNDQSTALRGQGLSHGAVVFLWEGTCPPMPQAHGQVDGSHARRGKPGQDALRLLCRDAERLGLHAHATVRRFDASTWERSQKRNP